MGTDFSSTDLTVFAMRMAGVFMISTATISLRTAVMPRWLAGLGYLLAAFLLFGAGSLAWAELLFPTWVLVVSIYLLLAVHPCGRSGRHVAHRSAHPDAPSPRITTAPRLPGREPTHPC
jgi:hypothetical protein